MRNVMEDTRRGDNPAAFRSGILCILCAVAMAYGWGFRGSYGHEAGAMVAGALLAMGASLSAFRKDWHRRTAVAGLFGALGWYVGGSMSNMEHTMYIISDSFPDVAYGYACIGLIGLLWSGVGGAALSLAFTRPRSELESYMRVVTVLWLFWLLLSAYFGICQDQGEALLNFGSKHFPRGDWYTAATVLALSGVYWVFRPKDRPATRLFLDCAVGWWLAYLVLFKISGLRLAPPYRGENWSGVVGILLAFLFHLWRQENRAGLMLALHSTLAGCMGFIVAVFIHVPIRLGWGPFPRIAPWKMAEEGFGFFMGIGVATSIAYLLRGRIAAPLENTKREPLDLFAAFVLLIVMMWMNLHKNVRDWGERRYDILVKETMYGLEAWQWFYVVGILLTLITAYCLFQYHRRTLMLLPQTAFEKGALLFSAILFVTLVAVAFHRFPEWNGKDDLISTISYWVLGLAAFWLLLTLSAEGRQACDPPPGIPPQDRRWRVGYRYWLLWALGVPLLTIAVTAATLGMQDNPNAGSRKRFGPDAYWRHVEELTGTWIAKYRVQDFGDKDKTEEALPIIELAFGNKGRVTAVLANNERMEKKHRWLHSNPYTRLHWYGQVAEHPERAVLTMHFQEKRLYVPWPPHGLQQGYIVFERVDHVR